MALSTPPPLYSTGVLRADYSVDKIKGWSIFRIHGISLLGKYPKIFITDIQFRSMKCLSLPLSSRFQLSTRVEAFLCVEYGE